MANPRILHRSIIAEAAALTISSTAAQYSAAHLADWRTYTQWGPATMPASIEVDAGCAVDADGLYIPQHTLDSTLCDVSLYAADLPFSGMQLITAPEDFANAAWTVSAATVTSNAVAAPDGTTTADFLFETSATSGHYIGRTVALSISSATVYTVSVYIKPGARTRFRLQDTSNGYADFNLSTQAVTATVNCTAAIGPLDANGFYRISITYTSGGTSATLRLSILDASGSASYTGDGSSGLYLWGSMVNPGSSAAPYIPQTAGRWISEAPLVWSNRIPDPTNLSTGTSLAGTPTVTAAYAFAPSGLKHGTWVQDTSAAQTQGIALATAGLHAGETTHRVGVLLRKTTADTHYAAIEAYATGGTTNPLIDLVLDTNTGAIAAVGGSTYVVSSGVEDCGDYWFFWAILTGMGNTGNSLLTTYFFPAFNTTGNSSASNAVTGGKVFYGAVLDKAQARPAPFRTDAPLYLPFAATSKRYWLIRINRKSGAALPSFGEIIIGKSLEVPTGMPQGFDPINRTFVGQQNSNGHGEPLGVSVWYTKRDLDLKFEKVNWSWARQVLAAAVDNRLSKQPFGVVWDFESAVEDTQWCDPVKDMKVPHYSAQVCDVVLKTSGVVR